MSTVLRRTCIEVEQTKNWVVPSSNCSTLSEVFVVSSLSLLMHSTWLTKNVTLETKVSLFEKRKKKQYILRRKLEANYLIFKRSKESSVMEMEGRKAKE